MNIAKCCMQLGPPSAPIRPIEFENSQFMATIFLADYDINNLRKKLDAIIEVKNEDNLRTHLRQILLFKDEGLVSGTVTGESFKIWTHEQGRAGVTSIFYPIVEGSNKLKKCINFLLLPLLNTDLNCNWLPILRSVKVVLNNFTNEYSYRMLTKIF